MATNRPRFEYSEPGDTKTSEGFPILGDPAIGFHDPATTAPEVREVRRAAGVVYFLKKDSDGNLVEHPEPYQLTGWADTHRRWSFPEDEHEGYNPSGNHLTSSDADPIFLVDGGQCFNSYWRAPWGDSEGISRVAPAPSQIDDASPITTRRIEWEFMWNYFDDESGRWRSFRPDYSFFSSLDDVFVTLTYAANRGPFKASVSAIAEMTGRSKASVHRSLKALIDSGVVTATKLNGRETEYAVNMTQEYR